ncbi:MAG: hypothetical protein IPM06_20150 [Rhizobiales bacterium]|nr:hypothetical protein [Hyphomicrobiales bacterium]
MANFVNSFSNAAILKTTYDSEFGLDPSEEGVITPFVSKPVGSTAIGNVLTLRKVAAHSASKWATVGNGTTGGLSTALTGTGNTEAAVTTTLAYAYVMCEIDEPGLTRLVDEQLPHRASQADGGCGQRPDRPGTSSLWRRACRCRSRTRTSARRSIWLPTASW